MELEEDTLMNGFRTAVCAVAMVVVWGCGGSEPTPEPEPAPATEVADACAIVPTISAHSVTPLAESFQAVIWHLIVSHPDVQVGETKW